MTTRKNQLSVVSLLVPLVLVAALLAGLVLVRKSQETRKGAYFAGTSMLLQPVQSNKNVGEDVPVALYVDTKVIGNTGEKAKVDFVKATICYGIGLKLDGGDIRSQITLNQDAFDTWQIAKLVPGTTKGCLVMAVSASQFIQLKSGMVQVATIRFKAATVGSGEITIDKTGSQVSGSNPNYSDANKDMSISVDSVAGAKYTISDSGSVGECGWCGNQCIRKTSKTICPTVQPPEGKVCKEVNGVCVISDAIVTPTKTVPPTMTPTPSPSTGGDSVLNYRIKFGGLASDARCASGWPVTITVLAGGVSKTYSDIPVRDGDVYKGTVVLSGFQAKEGVAVFIKGPKHLQMKYGKNGQTAAYAKAGGEISLTDSADTSPENDFSGYPMLAGDVVGVDSDIQDGWINGVDFSYVKQRSLTHETVDEGAYIQADLDGNCQVNSNDVNVLKISLNEKQGELY